MNQHDHQHTESPEMLSLMGYSLAREARQYHKGIELCLKAIALNPHNCDHYLHLGRIYLLAKKKDLAIKAFRKGLKIRKDARILDEIRLLGLRRSPPFASLSRNHLVNRLTGKILRALKLR
ncbi:MAG: tetratricopeptide repeat protein [Verrucomicrobia bacterium]|nr:tetratricopeptide repeat protein [Deltaproteobacteria bacterium]